ncbi:MAG: transglycosylase SLT domain-containing protein [Gammaproteobacteria bacterium]|nr:transglycosylase SLT domain-containing protein [Gammaproteobacteria bacterium]MBU1414902.1 transglycosylase SLT domain-containing protein [Gammaproteobacteria bacterium]
MLIRRLFLAALAGLSVAACSTLAPAVDPTDIPQPNASAAPQASASTPAPVSPEANDTPAQEQPPADAIGDSADPAPSGNVPTAGTAAAATPGDAESTPQADEAPPDAEPIVVSPLTPGAGEEVIAESRIATIDLTLPPDDLWQRIRNSFGMPDLHSPLVSERQAWYLNHPETIERITERSRLYLFHIVEELERRGMPTELALLPMIESAFNPLAASRSRALGIWQFIPSTGKVFKLDQNYWRDERRDVIASTDAALDYLQRIYEMQGDWHLTLASYNWGENAVARAVAHNRGRGLPTDYESLKMPRETRYYVPKLQALKNIIARPELFGLTLAPLPNEPYFDTVDLPGDMDVMVAAKLAETPVDEFIALNPAYHRPLIRADNSTQLLLPAAKVKVFQANLLSYTSQAKPLANWRTYQLGKGESLAKVAARHNISLIRLKQMNGITPRVKVRPGFNLLVPRPGAQISDLLATSLPKMSTGSRKAGKKGKRRKAAKSKRRSKATAKGRTSQKTTPRPSRRVVKRKAR